jgi:serine/threonine protein kinase/tetratricopeptide (TPR) repeat protein
MTERDLFIAARGMPDTAERAAFLAEACGGDTNLLHQVESLLGEQDALGSFLNEPAIEPNDTAVWPRAGEAVGTLIGPYKLLEQIGEGGFGVVYMAEQQRPVRRKVALKVIKPGMDSRQVVARFEAERQALALMEHPNIAGVLDGGTTAWSRPFFVMELVRGVPITDYCDQNRLPPRRRLDLFLSVCRAVQHAHQKGVIHRDLKPSNVLVTLHDGVPVPKLIDFGIAKAIGQQLTDKTLFTGFAQLVGTPLYMSPEQAELSGLDIDTRTDVYALGVLLYELLTGRTPFDEERLRAAGYDEMRRIIREEEPPKPSARVSTLGQAAATVLSHRQCDPRQLSTLLRGELDWIIMKALEKDRTRRYESAAALAADVERYLRDEPVNAGPPSKWYRWRKTARRHRSAIVTTALAIIGLAVTLAAVAGSIGWAVSDRAARETALNQEIGRTLDSATKLLGVGDWPQAQAVLDHAETLLVADRPHQRPRRLQELRLDTLTAKRLEEIDNSARSQGFDDLRKLDLAYAQAFRELGIDLFALPAAEAVERIRTRSIRLELARALDCWYSARSRMWTSGTPSWTDLLSLAKQADPDAWRIRVREAVERGDIKTLEALAAAADVRQLPPQSLNLLARALKYPTWRGPLASPWIVNDDELTDFLRRAQRQHPGDLWINLTLGDCQDLRHLDEALRFYSAAFAVRPNNPTIATRIGWVYWTRCAYPEAVAAFTKAVELGTDDENAWLMRGLAHFNLNRFEHAHADLSKSLDLNPRDAMARWGRGLVLERQYRWNQAVADYTTLIAQHPNLKSPSIGEVRLHRAYAYSILCQWGNAAADLAPQGIETAPLDDTWVQLACLRVLQGDVSGYQQLRRRWLQRLEQSGKSVSGEDAMRSCRIWLLQPGGDTDLAQAKHWAEVAIKSEPKGGYVHVQALLHYRAGQFDSAIARCHDSLNSGPSSRGAPLNWLLLGLARQRLGRADEARPWFARAAQWREGTLTGVYPAGVAYPPEASLSDWLEFQVLYREAESLFGEGHIRAHPVGGER